MEENLNIQEYADKHCGGDRFRAIWEMCQASKDGEFSKHIDELNQDEALFVLRYVDSPTSKMAKNYGAEFSVAYITMGKDFLIDVDKKEKNPFAQAVSKFSLMSVFAIAFIVFASVLDIKWLLVIASSFLGVFAINMANIIMGFFKFRKAKRIINRLPVSIEKACECVFPTFEEAMERFNRKPETITEEQADGTIDEYKKKNVIAILLLPVCLFFIIVCSAFIQESKVAILPCLASFVVMISQFISCLFVGRDVTTIPKSKTNTRYYERRKDTCKAVACIMAILYAIATMVAFLIFLMINGVLD